MGVIDKRIVMAERHIKVMKNKYAAETKLSIEKSKIYGPKDFSKKSDMKFVHFANLSFIKQDTPHAANDFKSTYPHAKTTVLNFADYLIPGGLYLKGGQLLKKKYYVMSPTYIWF